MTTPPSTPSKAGTGPSGLPDVAALAQLANELFKALPGQEPAVLSPVGAATDVPLSAVDVPAARGPGFAAPSAPGATSAAPSGGAQSSPVPAGSATIAPAYYFLDVPHSGTGAPGQALDVQVPPGFAAPSIDDRPDSAHERYFVQTPAQVPSFGTAGGDPVPGFDLNAVRRDFPILSERVNGKQLVWFDNAATTHKPRAVIDRLAYFYEHENSNIHRAAHELAARATDAYENARSITARFIGARSSDEIVFVRGTTEAINLVADSWGRANLGPGDEVVISHLEHHANIVPWLLLRDELGFAIKVIPVDDDGQVRLDEYVKLLSDRTKLVSVTQVSNALGTVTPTKQIVDLAHAAGACTLVDGAQSVSHLPTDVTALDTDFFVFSGHKVYGPTGIGVLYGKAAVLERMRPYQGGGNMITDVTFERALFAPPPSRFEAGTGNIADAVGLGAALEYLDQLGRPAVAAWEHDLLEYATQGMVQVPGLRLIGTAPAKASVLSFVLGGHTTEEVGRALSKEGIAVRAGHHCAQPILRRFGLETTVRPSLALYNTCTEVDQMLAVLHQLVRTTPGGSPSSRW